MSLFYQYIFPHMFRNIRDRLVRTDRLCIYHGRLWLVTVNRAPPPPLPSARVWPSFDLMRERVARHFPGILVFSCKLCTYVHIESSNNHTNSPFAVIGKRLTRGSPRQTCTTLSFMVMLTRASACILFSLLCFPPQANQVKHLVAPHAEVEGVEFWRLSTFQSCRLEYLLGKDMKRSFVS